MAGKKKITEAGKKKAAATRSRSMAIKKTKMLKALKQTLGVVSAACESLNIARASHYQWMENDPKYKEAVKEIQDVQLDFVESKLLENINNGDITSTIFYLKTKGKERGYIEKQQIEQDVKGEITIIRKVIDPKE